MFEISKSPKTLLILFIGFAGLSFALLQLTVKNSKSEANLNGYFQLIENASMPILLADQREQFSLQISALVQDTPVMQVRIYDNSEALLFRVQNGSTQTSNEATITLRNPLFFENSEAGFLEIDLDAGVVDSESATALQSLIVALSLSLLWIIILYFLLPANKVVTRSDTTSAPEISPTAIRPESPSSNPQLLVFVKTLIPAQKQDIETNLLLHISQISETINKMAKIYAAEPLALAANTLAFAIRGDAGKQAVHQATMLCWGLTQLQSKNDAGQAERVEIQSFVINPQDLLTDMQLSLPYWTEVCMRCDTGKTAGAYVAKSLTDRVDQTSFELAPSKGDFLRINDVNSSIKKLWQNQRGNI